MNKRKQKNIQPVNYASDTATNDIRINPLEAFQAVGLNPFRNAPPNFQPEAKIDGTLIVHHGENVIRMRRYTTSNTVLDVFDLPVRDIMQNKVGAIHPSRLTSDELVKLKQLATSLGEPFESVANTYLELCPVALIAGDGRQFPMLSSNFKLFIEWLEHRLRHKLMFGPKKESEDHVEQPTIGPDDAPPPSA